MPLYKPSELLQFLKELKIQPKKSLSQNFLLDRNIWEKILKTAAIEKGDTVLEIGPGPGSLTELLLEKGADVLAVELDKTFAEALQRLDSPKVYNEDILKFEIPDNVPKLKILSNLPFHIAAPILTKFAPLKEQVNTMTVILQGEMARRLTAKPKTKDYSSLTLFLNFYAEVSYCFPVSKNCFYPKPRVDSAVIHLTLRTPPKVSDDTAFFELVRTAFNQRRKKLSTSLKKLYPQENIRELVGDARPEELTLERFIDLFEGLEKSG